MISYSLKFSDKIDGFSWMSGLVRLVLTGVIGFRLLINGGGKL